MNIPLTISVVIPTYNSAKTLSACLNSIVMQQHTDKEIIVVDGRSADHTMDIVRQYAAEHACLKYVSEKDKGIYDAMNKGIRMAQGSWVIFLGADDELYDSHVLVRVSEKLQSTKAKLVYGNAKVVGESSWAKDGAVYDGPFTVKKLFQKNICHQAIFYKKEVFDEVGYFNPDYYVCADWDLNFRCFAKTQVEYIDLIVSKFSGGGFSTTHTADPFSMNSVDILKGYFGITYRNALFNGYGWVFYEMALQAWNKGNTRKAGRLFFFAFWHAEKKWDMVTVSLGRLRKRAAGR